MAFEPVDRINPGDLKKRLKEIHKKLTSKNQAYEVDKEVYRRLVKHAEKIIPEGIDKKGKIDLDKRIVQDFLKGNIRGLAKPQNALETLSNPLFRRKLANFVKKPRQDWADV